MKIGIVSAMPIELNYLLKNLSYEKKEMKRNTFFIATYKKYELFIVASGIGKVNAATYSQILIDAFSPDMIINLGIAGALDEGLNHLDLVIGSSYSHHDVNVAQMENLFPHTSIFYANQHLLNIFSANDFDGMMGPIVSGEKFIADSSEKNKIIDTFNAVAVDMETSAIAHTCFINELPFISLRCISDLANDEADDSYESNKIPASDLAGKTLLTILEAEKIR